MTKYCDRYITKTETLFSKMNQQVHPNTYHNICTPFDKCTNFEPHILLIIDKYLDKIQSIDLNHSHWLVAWGISNKHNRAFQNACRVGSLQTAQVIFPNISDKTNRIKNRACRQAASNGHLYTVKYLVSLGADITNEDNSAVRCAAYNGRLDVVKYLVSVGADITTYNNEAVCSAAENGHLDVVKYLVSCGADITAQNNYAVFNAAEHGHLDIVKYLVSLGADITSQDPKMVTWT